MKRYLKNIIKISVTFFVLLGLFLLLKIVVYLLPVAPIQKNIEYSLDSIEYAGMYPIVGMRYGAYSDPSQINYCTEYNLLTNNYIADRKDPINAAILNTCYNGPGDNQEDLFEAVKNKKQASETKGQYWWGIQVILRPLLYFFPYSKAIGLYKIIFYILLIITVLSMNKKLGLGITLCFIASLLFVKIDMVTYSLVSGSTFVIGMGAILFFLQDKSDNLMYSFFVIGSLTAFFDWLSTPIVTVSLPLSIIILKRWNSTYNYKFIEGVKVIFYSSVGWCLGYGGFIVAKQAVLLLNGNDAKQVFLQRIGDGLNNQVSWAPQDKTEYIISTLLNANFYKTEWVQIFGKKSIVFLLLLMIVLAIITICMTKKFRTIQCNFLLLIVGCMPIIWWYVFKGHSFVHGWFTYRSAGVVFLSIFGSIYIYCMDIKKYITANREQFMKKKINK